ncbi:peptidoglycan-binding domain-containing protein [Streptomyces sp. NRRL S-241]|uniref:peptidoglycan-binding domain-containing protein n=1 Tax=Streptomyces sp. NRRL S-241 TaxID=1463896 RepID=UPI0004BE7496|nr:peptidoglycan-binding domain-containing protein [Streptomyces sp. NRRL S-241]
MPQDPDESRLVPEDHLLVRPYVAPSGRPPRPTAPAPAPAWSQPGPLAFPGPAGVPAPAAAAPVPVPVPFSPPARAAARSRLPFAVTTLLALAAVGALVLLLSGPDPRPPRAGAPAELSVPVLPERSPDAAADTGAPAPTASVRPIEPSASPSPPSTGRAPQPPAAPSPSATGSPASPGTLRMGDSGPEVRALQELLHGQGFTYVSVTGVFDNQTKRGVSQLQRDRSIKGDPNGVYGPATRAAMQ